MVLMVLLIRAGADHPPDGGSGADGPAGHPPDGADGPDGSNQAKQKWDKRPDDQDGSGFIN
jgi:hypothetical protein